MDITRFALDRRAVTFVLLLVLAFAGISSYNDMPKAEDPGFLIRIAVVMTQFPGASPDRVEQLVTDKLEKAIQEMPELDSIKSTSKSGVSIINVELQERYTDLQPIWDRLRRKVEPDPSKPRLIQTAVRGRYLIVGEVVERGLLRVGKEHYETVGFELRKEAKR